MAARFRDTGEAIYDFGDTFLVRCPRCAARGHVIPAPGAPTADGPGDLLERTMRLACPSCGYVDESPQPRRGGRRLAVGAAVDWYFGQPLWLQAPCAGETLWAYNARHLDFLERFVGAELRGWPRAGETWRRNSTLASRLPAWMKDAKNRDAVLRGIQRLREMLD
jgi:hypothetical protein